MNCKLDILQQMLGSKDTSIPSDLKRKIVGPCKWQSQRPKA